MTKSEALGSSSRIEVIWEPQTGPQTALLACPIFEVFFGGARGGGKTDGMLGEWISHQDQFGEHCNAIMFRRERTQLVDTIERSRQLFRPLGAVFHEQEKLWRFPNGSRFQFAYLDRDSDADAYQGRSHTRVYIEEIGTFPSPSPIFKLMATLRSGHGIPCGFRATGNPGGPGHQWVRARYIDPAPLGWRTISETYVNPWTKEAVKRERIYIPSKLSDNRYLGSDYVANLQMVGNAQLVRAWLEGDWSVIEGAFFPEFSEAKHVIAPFEVPASWGRFRAADWGSAKPFSIGWYSVVGDSFKLERAHDRRSIILPRGALVRYREWYGVREGEANVGLKMTGAAVAKGIVEREVGEPKDLEGKTGIAYGVLDPSCFDADGGPCIAEEMAAPPSRVFFRHADNRRTAKVGAIGGWDQVRARLTGTAQVNEKTGSVDWNTGEPMLYFFSTCVHAIRTLPALQHDATKPEDVDTDAEDHAPDEIRYACMSRPYIKQIPSRPESKILAVGPGNQVSLDDLWDKPEKVRRTRV
jgi:hypothetical protein